MDFDTFIDSACANLGVVEEQYALYLLDPKKVHSSWHTFFQKLDENPKTRLLSKNLSSLSKNEAKKEKEVSVLYHKKNEPIENLDDKIQRLIDAYRTYGHLVANINPISEAPLQEPPQLKLDRFHLTKQDFAISYPTFGFLQEERAPLLSLFNALRKIYCGTIGFEYMGMQNLEMERWIQERIEPSVRQAHLSISQKQMILQQLNRAELLEVFLHTKYVGQKRFSLEGAESLIPMFTALIEQGGVLGVEEFVIGMAHRGRLNVLCNIFKKSYAEVFSEFDEGYQPPREEGSGDVKYHKGYSADITTESGKKVHLELSPNPSHLEAVDPVIEGITRAKQLKKGYRTRAYYPDSRTWGCIPLWSGCGL